MQLAPMFHQKHPSLTSPVTRQPKSSSRRAMPKCHDCGRILMNRVSSGMWSLFRTTSVASLLAWNICKVRHKAVSLKSLFMKGTLSGQESSTSLNATSGFVVLGVLESLWKKKISFSSCSNWKIKDELCKKKFWKEGIFCFWAESKQRKEIEKRKHFRS